MRPNASSMQAFAHMRWLTSIIQRPVMKQQKTFYCIVHVLAATPFGTSRTNPTRLSVDVCPPTSCWGLKRKKGLLRLAYKRQIQTFLISHFLQFLFFFFISLANGLWVQRLKPAPDPIPHKLFSLSLLSLSISSFSLSHTHIYTHISFAFLLFFHSPLPFYISADRGFLILAPPTWLRKLKDLGLTATPTSPTSRSRNFTTRKSSTCRPWSKATS